MTVGALANAALVESLPDGSALLIHQLLTPRAFRVAPGLGAATPVPVPTPDATRDLIGFVPHAPVTEDQFARILTPALALSVDRGRGDLYLLTRSGRQVNGRAERAVLRLDSELRYVASYTLDVHAVEMAALPARSALLVADDEDRIFLCSSHAETRGE